MANLENTQYFNVKTDPAVRVKEVLDLVYNAMAEKGYNPVNSGYGYYYVRRPHIYYQL